ncbi:MAG: hypothetical protein C0433_20390 [Cyclobacterium sp.]|nr:hypothetical protein [Cyclobacterium sp.]
MHAFSNYSIIIPAILAFKSRRDERIIDLVVFIRKDNPRGVESFLSKMVKREIPALSPVDNKGFAKD